MAPRADTIFTELVRSAAAILGLGTGTPIEYILIQDQKPSGTASGGFTLGAWRTRDLTTIVQDDTGLVALALNVVTLPAGTYRMRCNAPAYGVGRHALRLQDTTAPATLVSGNCGHNHTVIPLAGSIANMEGYFTIAVPTDIEVQHQSEGTVAVTGMGLAAGSSFAVAHEVYASLELWKVA